jgi:hypothetical protein
VRSRGRPTSALEPLSNGFESKSRRASRFAQGRDPAELHPWTCDSRVRSVTNARPVGRTWMPRVAPCATCHAVSRARWRSSQTTASGCRRYGTAARVIRSSRRRLTVGSRNGLDSAQRRARRPWIPRTGCSRCRVGALPIDDYGLHEWARLAVALMQFPPWHQLPDPRCNRPVSIDLHAYAAGGYADIEIRGSTIGGLTLTNTRPASLLTTIRRIAGGTHAPIQRCAPKRRSSHSASIPCGGPK